MPKAPVYRCGAFEVDTANRRFLRDGCEMALEPRVFSVIARLLAHAGQLVERNDLLDAVWGHRYVTPSTLNRTIALARRAFGDDAGAPRFIQTVHGAGYCYTGPIQGLAAVPVEVRFAPPPSARVPERIRPLIGRESDLAQLSALLAEHRAVTVLGTGGMGKTQCALEVARRIATRYEDGVWFFDLTPFGDAPECLAALAAALSIQAAGPSGLAVRIAETLREREVLLLLDNCDRIAGAVGECVAALLAATRRVTVLATSQSPLDFVGEALLRLPPLALPPPGDGDAPAIDALAEVPAVAMLLEAIKSTHPGFRLGAGNAAAVVAICRALDGMPLALELAGARFVMLSPEQVLQRLEQRFAFLATSNSGRERRHRNLRAVLEWSCALLSPAEQAMLAACATFRHSWSVEAFIAMAGEAGFAPDLGIELLQGLVDHGLVAVMDDCAPPRYRMLETVREYAGEQLLKSGRQEALSRAHLRVMTGLCEQFQADLVAGRDDRRFTQFVLDRDNVGTALDAALGSLADPQSALRIIGALLLHAKGHGDYQRVFGWAQRVLAGAPADDSRARGRALATAGVLEMHLTAAARTGRSLLPEAARIACLNEDPWTEAFAHGYYALSLANWGRTGEAAQLAERTEVLAGELGDGLLAGLAALARGWIALAEGDSGHAVRCLEPALCLGSDRHQHSFVATYVGFARYMLGDHAQAAAFWLQGLELGIALGNVRAMAGAIEGSGYLACALGQHELAARFLAVARRMRDRTGIPLFNFWRAPLAAAEQALAAALSPELLAAAAMAGSRQRDEVSANEALAMLRRLAGTPHRSG